METDLFKLGDTLVAKECLVDKNNRTFITLTEEYVVYKDVHEDLFVKDDDDNRHYLSASDFEGNNPIFEVSEVLDIDEKFDILLNKVRRDAELITKLERKVDVLSFKLSSYRESE